MYYPRYMKYPEYRNSYRQKSRSVTEGRTGMRAAAEMRNDC